MARQYRASTQNLRDYFRLFVNRRAYVMQSVRPHPETGRHYYFRPRAASGGEPSSLTAETVRRHLEGEITIGIYAINPATQRSKWIAIDGDYKNSIQHLCQLQWELGQGGVESALEMSRRGAHLWIFGAAPLLARECRRLMTQMADKLKIPVKGTGQAEGIEIFPKHDEIREGDFGNAIRGPLGIHRAIAARYWFYGADYDFDRQLAYLDRLQKLSEAHLRQLISRESATPIAGTPPASSTRPRISGAGAFRILEHVTATRKIGRNWVTRCPSCAAAGRDRSGDNLAISVEEPLKYICWAGCTKEMIRSALGCALRETAFAPSRR